MLNKDVFERLQILSCDRANTKPTVVAYGLMNTGKSSLLNILTKHIDQEFFKTDDVRATTETNQFESDKYIYLDTPGLDANGSDDLQAQLGVSQADVVLFLHQPQGALEANEVRFLKELNKSFRECAASNIIIVLNKIDKEDEAKISLIESEIRQQCQKEIGFSPKVFQVSNKRYQTGILKHKDGLVNQSHIKPLIEYIDIVASNAISVRVKRSMSELEALQEQLSSKEQILKTKRAQVINSIEQAFSLFNYQINSLNDFLEDSSKKYRAI